MGVLTGYMGAAPALVWASGVLFVALAPVLVPSGDLDLHAGVRVRGTVVRALHAGSALEVLRAEAAAAPPPAPAPMSLPTHPAASLRLPPP
jgi:hypothetical protein